MKLPYRHIFANQDLRDLTLFVEGVDKHWTISYLRSALQQKKSTPPDGSSFFSGTGRYNYLNDRYNVHPLDQCCFNQAY